MIHDPTFWVGTAFIAFIALILYLRVPGKFLSSLDDRAEKIKSDLDSAEALLKESQDLLASYQKKQRDAGNEAGTMALLAREEAEEILREGRKRLEENLERRQELVFARIKQAETTAIEKIRLETVDIAMEASKDIIRQALTEDKAQMLINNSAKELTELLHRESSN